MDESLNTKRILIFLGLAFGIPWAAALAIALTGVWGNNPLQAVTLANLVFISTPMVANVATRLLTKEGWGHFMLQPNFRHGWRFWLAAWLLPFLAAVVGGVIFYLLFPQSFDSNLGAVRKLTASIPSAATINPWLIIMSIAIQSLLIAVPINAVASLGEELGWRAYLLPKLMERFAGAEHPNASTEAPVHLSHPDMAGTRRAALLVGLIHGVWHWPLFFLSTRLDSSSAFPFPLVYLVFTCSLSVLLSWATHPEHWQCMASRARAWCSQCYFVSDGVSAERTSHPDHRSGAYRLDRRSGVSPGCLGVALQPHKIHRVGLRAG